MTRPLSHGDHMLAHDAGALSNVLRRTMTQSPGERDITVISRALRRAIADEKRKNTEIIVKHLTEAISLASTAAFDKSRSKFQRLLRSAISALVDERGRKAMSRADRERSRSS